MIEVNGYKLEPAKFPDGTSSIRFPTNHTDNNRYFLTWKYDGDEECMVIWHLVHHIRESSVHASIVLNMPYIPNARMDRVKNADEIFTLKWFAEFINSLNFDSVEILDPHSNVGTALIDRVSVLCATEAVSKTIALICCDDNLILCYPDEGARKKYSEEILGEYVYCVKNRDWRTGKIEGLELNNSEIVEGEDVLIVDDICSRGGTFMYTANALKEAGAGKIYLYVTHCENTIFEGEILESDLISHVFTTDSIYRGTHEKITVVG